MINDQGLRNSNIDGDLKVEHVNKMFKAGIINLSGKYSESNLRRVALTMDMGKALEDKLYPNYVGSDESAFKSHLGHRKVDWSDQVYRGVLDMKEQKVLEYLPGRKVEGFKCKSQVDRKGLERFIKKQNKEMTLFRRETFKGSR